MGSRHIFELNGDDYHSRYVGVFEEGVTEERIMDILTQPRCTCRNTVEPILALRDTDESAGMGVIELAAYEQSDKCGVCWRVNLDTRMLQKTIVNGGLGGIPEEGRNKSNFRYEVIDLGELAKAREAYKSAGAREAYAPGKGKPKAAFELPAAKMFECGADADIIKKALGGKAGYDPDKLAEYFGSDSLKGKYVAVTNLAVKGKDTFIVIDPANIGYSVREGCKAIVLDDNSFTVDIDKNGDPYAAIVSPGETRNIVAAELAKRTKARSALVLAALGDFGGGNSDGDDDGPGGGLQLDGPDRDDGPEL